MPFVLDAPIAACWAFDDEDHPVAASALERIRTDEALVPSLWWFEVRNTLIVSERRGRLTESDTAAFLRGLARLRVTIDQSPELRRAVRARGHFPQRRGGDQAHFPGLAPGRSAMENAAPEMGRG